MTIIETRQLGYHIGDRRILDGISFAVRQGEYLAVVGPNGAGKTTLVRCLGRILRDWTGEVLLSGRSLRRYRQRQLGALLSYVPQATYRPLPFTVEEFVMMGRYPHLAAFGLPRASDRGAVQLALEATETGHLRHRTLATLSGGERQMVFLAAALAQAPRLLLLDEPSTFLDYRHQAQVNRILRQVNSSSGTAIITVHHDVNHAIDCAHRVLALKEGKLFFLGDTADFLEPGRAEALYDIGFCRSANTPGGRVRLLPEDPA
ncbi:MAG TPA: ABC transporter ATP-binding protein [Verrucomicrobiae bacterium]|nr:ABC transporter ATP-binding protein [Verrucomicrobiae bacterium]